MASGLARLMGALTARVIGAAFFFTAAVNLIWAVHRIEAGSAATRPIAIIFPLVVGVVTGILAIIFLSPDATRSVLRQRKSFVGRVFAGVLGMLVVALAFLFSAGLLRTILEPDSKIPILVFVIGCVIWLAYCSLFIAPGDYAKDLAHRTARRPNARPRRYPADNDNFIPGLADTNDETYGSLKERVEQRARDARLARKSVQKPSPYQPLGLVRTRAPEPKLVSWSLFVGMIPFAVFFIGMISAGHAHFIPTTDQIALAKDWATPFSIGLGAVAGLAIALDKHSASKIRGPFARFFLGTPMMAAIAFMFAKSFITIGGPVIHSMARPGAPERLPIVVTRVGKDIARKSCNRVLYGAAAGRYSGHEFKVCDVPRPIWESSARGDLLILQGYATPYGFRYSDVTR